MSRGGGPGGDDGVRPRVVLSECMADVPCRYDGRTVPDDFVSRLGAFVDYVRVCPEVRIGLGVPRDPIRVVSGGGTRVTLVQPATGRDLTREMTSFAAGFLDGLGPVDGFLLKARSPSCGPSRVKVHAPRGVVLRRGAGLFAAAAVARRPDVAVEDEERLADARSRDRFLTRVFASARLRAVRDRGALARFHAAHEPLLLARGLRRVRELRRIVDEGERGPREEVLAAYGRAFLAALARPPRVAAGALAFERYPAALASPAE